ncbi:MAG: hypothetical protein J6D47_11405 [Peptostreptococcaceae bacterium]|nr:hypothetical protein [Peptostreptococcaceae bacterium]MBP3930154.1 hypothetical protein [Peptostreptococcaceae bacterium]
MKILVNGSSITEIVSESITSINIYPRGREFDFEAFISSEDKDVSISLLDRAIGHIKKNKRMYIRLVYLVVIYFNGLGITVFANGYNPLTMEFFGYIKMAVRALMLIGFPVEMIKCVSSGTLESMGKISIKYIALGLSIRFLPDIVATLLP